jgi:hypothetical protein
MHLCIEACYAKNVEVKMLARGMKIYEARISRGKRHLRLKDSLNFFHASLASLRAAYRLESECEDKPHFPHLFTTRSNLQLQCSNLPPLADYDAGSMSVVERERFLRYYNNNYHTPFNLATQMVEYCQNDVRLLRSACLKFRQIFLETAGIDPWLVANTVAKLAQVVYLKNYMPVRSIVNAPEKGYRLAERASIAARKYFRFYAERHPHYTVRTADYYCGEARVGDTGYRLDAFVTRGERRRPLAIEFLGCYYHG